MKKYIGILVRIALESVNGWPFCNIYLSIHEHEKNFHLLVFSICLSFYYMCFTTLIINLPWYLNFSNEVISLKSCYDFHLYMQRLVIFVCLFCNLFHCWMHLSYVGFPGGVSRLLCIEFYHLKIRMLWFFFSYVYFFFLSF